MVPVIIEKKKYTYEDYLKTPEDKRYELINGELTMTPSPVPEHQLISVELLFRLKKFTIENNLGTVMHAPCDVYLDNENVVQPDILFISKDRLGIIGEKNIQGAPDLVIEIISEHSVYRDMVQKKKLYARFGVKEYWIVIPDEKEIEVYILKDNIYQLYQTYSKTDTLESLALKGLKIVLKEIFSE
ncbi:MAG: restriction endonuclease [Candidatus Brocadia sp. WS118]|nr:MAG: restriction endonuclease [Candidatus Brocadia sp. WS118]